MPYGLRGLLGARLSLRTGEVDAHSGVTGGAARNPLTELCALAHACVDAKTGRVKIPRFYDDVIPPTKAEMKSFLASGFQVKRFMQAYRFQTLRTTQVEDVLRRIWASPTFEVHGLVGGYTGPGVKTVVPGSGRIESQHAARAESTARAGFPTVQTSSSRSKILELRSRRKECCSRFAASSTVRTRRPPSAPSKPDLEKSRPSSRRWIDRRRIHSPAGVEGAHPLHGTEFARTWVSCPQ